MDTDKLMITDLDSAPTYCRRYNGATFDDYDTEAGTVFGTEKSLWANAGTDSMYWGKLTTFNSLGFYLHTAGAYGTVDFAYSKGASVWGALTPYHASISSFSQKGYVAWVIPGDWATDTIDGVAAYWIKATVASVTTVAKMYNFMLNVILKPPIIVDYARSYELKHNDVNGEQQTSDLAYTGPDRLSIDCTNITVSMDDLNLLWHFAHTGHNLHIYDPAQSAIRDPDADAYYLDCYGYLVTAPPRTMSPGKMDPKSYTLEFKIKQVSTLL